MKKKTVLLLIIFIAGLYLRAQNVNWDSGFHLHPDERFLTMVGNAMRLPASLGEYLDPSRSPFNPANVGYQFFVYGVFPVVLNKIIALFLRQDNYLLFTLQGRVLSALADLASAFFVYRTALLLQEKKKAGPRLKYWALFLYCISVLPVQLSHFFASDTFLNLFMFASFYFALKFYYDRSYRSVVASALFLGLGIASKANAVYILPLLLFFFAAPYIRRQWRILIPVCFVFFGVLYLTVRFADPYYFATPDLFDPAPNGVFVQNIQMLKSFEGKDVLYPPSLQWIHTVPFFFSVFNLALFGLGVPQFLLLCLGLAVVAGGIVRRRQGARFPRTESVAVTLWVAGIFLYQSVQFVKVLRYFIFLYPFFALYAAAGLEWLLGRSNKRVMGGVAVAVLLVWPLVFTSIYRTDNTRVEASRWINDHVPARSLILGEYWDDPLPLYQDTGAGKEFRIGQIKIFDPESKEKWATIDAQLKEADYYVLSSNRGWGSIPAVGDRFPESAAFYDRLFRGKEGYTLVKSFYPAYYPCGASSSGCPRFLSSWFDESFTVYDHPTVYIFKNNGKNH